ncbi:MAG: hypothetical protein NTY63_05240 [Candidatus Bipolaricaulota bacterium]|nr:hypothetical protein [Candidatus Bipolaricaulota bacterium]
MEDKTALLIALAVGIIVIVGLLFFVIPEPGERAVIATERLDIAVLAFRNSSSWSGVQETVRGRIETGLVNESGIHVYSRTQLDALLLEQSLSATGLLDPATAVKIGSLTGVSKLVTGSVYAVDTSAEATTACARWENGACAETVPATTYAAKISAQVEVIDAKTGQIEQSMDVDGSDSSTVLQGTVFGGFDSLLADSSSEIASEVAGNLTSNYTREVRYGLYEDVETKRNGYVGKNETRRFAAGSDVRLVLHYTRVRDGDLFDLDWTGPSGESVGHVEDVVSNGDWSLQTLDAAALAPGRYVVTGTLNGIVAFQEPFTLVP